MTGIDSMCIYKIINSFFDLDIMFEAFAYLYILKRPNYFSNYALHQQEQCKSQQRQTRARKTIIFR